MKTSNVKKVKKCIADNNELIQQFTGMTSEEYNTFFFDLAIKWAEKFTQDQEATRVLTTDSLFWGWWAIEFDKRNEKFIGYVQFNIDSPTHQYHIMIQSSNSIRCVNSAKGIRNIYEGKMDDEMLNCPSCSRLMEISFHKSLKTA